MYVLVYSMFVRHKEHLLISAILLFLTSKEIDYFLFHFWKLWKKNFVITLSLLKEITIQVRLRTIYSLIVRQWHAQSNSFLYGWWITSIFEVKNNNNTKCISFEVALKETICPTKMNDVVARKRNRYISLNLLKMCFLYWFL